MVPVHGKEDHGETAKVAPVHGKEDHGETAKVALT